MATRRLICWLRNDLRLIDNPVLHEGARRARAAGGARTEVLPVYVFDPATIGGAHPEYASTPTSVGGGEAVPRYSASKARFELDCVLDLKSRLRGIGSDLLIAVGNAEDVVRALCRPDDDDEDARLECVVLAAAEVTAEERRTERCITAAAKRASGAKAGSQCRVELLKGAASMYDADDVAGLFGSKCESMPDVFTPFRNRVESRLEVPAPLPAPAHGSLPLPMQTSFGAFSIDFVPRSVTQLGLDESNVRVFNADAAATNAATSAFPFHGGETCALERLQSYLWDTDGLSRYFETRNGMLGTEYSSKFSPFLARGCVSARTIFAEVKRYERSRVSNKSTYWLVFELIWRDFFRFFAAKHGSAIFRETGTMPPHTRLAWRGPDEHGAECLQRWRYGRTGYPLVDANMRELLATGFMSNRGRQNVASFLIFDYGIDWRYGASWFESLLVDYDPASNWGNWVAAAGLTGGRLNRFNVVKQQRDYDPNGEYIRAWLPDAETITRMSPHDLGNASRYGVLGRSGGAQQQQQQRGERGHGKPAHSRQRATARPRPRVPRGRVL